MKHPIKKPTAAVLAILAALVLGVAVLAALNNQNAAAKQRLRADAVFLIHNGQAEARVTMEEFLRLPLHEIQANYKKSGKDPETRVYTGISFAAVLRMKEIDPAGAGAVTFSAADSYASVLSLEDALNEENCFIVADESDEGPFRMILAKDQFSQRWCKLLTEVTLK